MSICISILWIIIRTLIQKYRRSNRNSQSRTSGKDMATRSRTPSENMSVINSIMTAMVFIKCVLPFQSPPVLYWHDPCSKWRSMCVHIWFLASLVFDNLMTGKLSWRATHLSSQAITPATESRLLQYSVDECTYVSRKFSRNINSSYAARDRTWMHVGDAGRTPARLQHQWCSTYWCTLQRIGTGESYATSGQRL